MPREMANYRGTETWLGSDVVTLHDILPTDGRTIMLIVGKRPAPSSVQIGHYFRGAHGTAFWNLLRSHGILDFDPLTEYPDDRLVEQGFGITDVVKAPAEYGRDPKPADYRHGSPLLLAKIQRLRPVIIAFTYRTVIGKVLRAIDERSNLTVHTHYGFNDEYSGSFGGSRVFACPIPGVQGCTSAVLDQAYSDLDAAIRDARLQR